VPISCRKVVQVSISLVCSLYPRRSQPHPVKTQILALKHIKTRICKCSAQVGCKYFC